MTDMTEFLIAFSITMLILTLVSERLSNFIKLFLQDKDIYVFYPHTRNRKLKIFLKSRISILSIKQPTKSAEKEREYRVLVITLLTSFVIAAFLNINLFQVINVLFENSLQGTEFKSPITPITISNPIIWYGVVFITLFYWIIILTLYKHLCERENKGHPKASSIILLSIAFFVILPLLLIWLTGSSEKCSFTWGDYRLIVYHILGYIGTGLFLSLGSKFWHDFLDLLFKIKNTKQRLSEEETFKNYSTTEEIVNMAETPRDKVVDALYNKYKSDIASIEGIVSYGMNTVFDEKSRLFKKSIEVEFTNAEAQQNLSELREHGFVEVNYNTYYLKHYMDILFTSELAALDSETVSASKNQTHKLLYEEPVCYAFNKKEEKSFGSFGVFEDNGKYYAISNLHVFATSGDLKNIHNSSNYIIEEQNRIVVFVIGTKQKEGKILDDYKFLNLHGNGYDYCKCEIDKETYDLFNATIVKSKLEVNHLDYMTMFGALSKYNVRFHNLRSGTVCRIKYNNFLKELYLYKIIPTNKNVQRGDSGSIVYYRSQGKIFKAMIIAKSDTYAYIQFISN
jgi:hypothetical protein